jgi:hypothetical protein
VELPTRDGAQGSRPIRASLEYARQFPCWAAVLAQVKSDVLERPSMPSNPPLTCLNMVGGVRVGGLLTRGETWCCTTTFEGYEWAKNTL